MSKARREALRTLHKAQRRIDRLGSLRRGSSRKHLLTEMAESHAALQLADETLTTLAGVRGTRGAPEPERREVEL
jgi:hypothetical protein